MLLNCFEGDAYPAERHNIRLTLSCSEALVSPAQWDWRSSVSGSEFSDQKLGVKLHTL